jgi:DNA-binding response OmpR family regulator
MAHETSQGMQTPPPERRQYGRALRIIVADDDRDTVDTLSRVLAGQGHVVHGVYAGKDVLPAASLFRPDAIILDMAIPEMSGFAVAQAIRQSFMDMRRPLLIALSGMWKDFADREIARQVGFDHYLVKPADPAELAALLEPLRAPR